ncbi:fructoselysine 6-kinase [Arthrobacter sp. V4I6]|uniref:PfkB family carbohydrate kinase n=1 Tax=unclassified Arthrobacter TaxID=235627 RepID=UPI002788C968|nr:MULTISPECIES: PfkB family carbohydrate kinase [unclassified Arthrobacter]MDQ0819514.1 fructoselysine 6-kinase [Arthrobacter sp. V1I7]MDQ0853696.1 fructoselysine 6-kinase [Arthrobacter sp. V4I6]
MKVIGFGDNIVDRFLDRRVIYPGGNCVNFAVLARRLGVDSAYLGVFGSDVHGDFVRSALQEEGVDISRCVIREGPNGVSEIKVVDGDRIFLGWNDGGVTISQPFTLEPEHLAYLATADLVHSSVYSASEPQLPAVRTAGTLVSFDYSSEPERRTDQYLRRTAPFIDLALLSLGGHNLHSAEHELRRVVAAGASLAVGTKGADGAVLFDGNDFLTQKAAPTDALRFADTMGCGDAFLTGLVVSLLKAGWTRHSRPSPDSLREALAFAAGTAAEQCYVEGAFGYGRPVAAPTRI